MKKTFVAITLGLFLVGAGCAPAPASESPGTTVIGITLLSEASNKTTVNAKVGDDIQVVLHSTYWEFAAPTGDAVKQVSEPTVIPVIGPGHIPGSGDGTVTVDYTVEKAGTSVVSASRTSCGEALQCTGDQGSFSFTINVQ